MLSLFFFCAIFILQAPSTFALLNFAPLHQHTLSQAITMQAMRTTINVRAQSNTGNTPAIAAPTDIGVKVAKRVVRGGASSSR